MPKFEFNRDTLEARDVAADCTSMEQRIEAFRDLMPSNDPALIVGEEDQKTMQSEPCVPEVPAAELTIDVLRSAIEEHGALIVRNMFSKAETDTLITTIDQVLDAFDSPKEVRSKLSTPYYNPPGNMASSMPNKAEELGLLRLFNRAAGAAMCAEAPSVCEALLQLYEKHGLKELISEYLGEPPCLSVKKWVLRRSSLPLEEQGWHQDGAFMGTDINSINLWLPLTECGDETGAPSMDVVPQRLYKIASAEGAPFDWAVSDSYVRSGAFKGLPLSPVFNAGDAFFFDHLYLHRTQFRNDFTRIRYAVENWFFGVTTFSQRPGPYRMVVNTPRQV